MFRLHKYIILGIAAHLAAQNEPLHATDSYMLANVKKLVISILFIIYILILLTTIIIIVVMIMLLLLAKSFGGDFLKS